MDAQIDETLVRIHRRKGLVHFSLFFLLILGGIIAKRGYGHPEYMMLFHGPAAVFLVLSGMHFTWQQRVRWALLTAAVRSRK